MTWDCDDYAGHDDIVGAAQIADETPVERLIAALTAEAKDIEAVSRAAWTDVDALVLLARADERRELAKRLRGIA